MIELFQIPPNVLATEGHEVSPTEMRELVRAWLDEHGGMNSWEAELAATQVRLDQAWYNDTVGFMNQGHTTDDEHPLGGGHSARPITIAVVPGVEW